MFSIRPSVFETNSSSTHSLTMCMNDDFEHFKHGETFLNESYGSRSKYADKQFVSKSEAIDIIINFPYETMNETEDNLMTMSEEEFESLCGEYEIYSYDAYGGYHERFSDRFTAPSGDIVVAFGYYGWD